MASRLGADVDDVRIHTDPAAAASARAVRANAYTVGRHIVFAPGAYKPDTDDGTRLLGHELAHVGQDRVSGAGRAVHRDGPSQGPITARSIFPYEQNQRVTVNHLIPDLLLNMIEGKNPALGGMFRQLVARTATVTTSTDDLVEAVIDVEPATTDRPARGSLAMRLVRSGSTFDLEFFEIDAQGNRTSLPGLPGLAARREGSSIALTGKVEGIDVGFVVGRGQNERETRLRATSPMELDLLSIESLGSARAGSAQERRIVSEAARSIGSARRTPRQRLSVSGGGLVLGSEPIAPLLGASWQMSFVPIRSLGSLGQVPIEVQLQYAPSRDFFARISSGAELSLAPLVPVNVRLVAGVAAASVHAEPGAPEAGRRVLLGPTVGGGLGYERGWFRTEVRYEYLWSLLERSPSAHALSLRIGAAF